MVQTTKEPNIPIGMPFCGFFASCAAVETASKPINAKNTRAAPAAIPEIPNSPLTPVFAGI
ncbi:hypothetical protein D3C85_1445790 [compost metagenome]